MEQSDNEKEADSQEEYETLDFTKPDFVFKPNEVHEWRQEGPYLICKSCELIHAQHIGMDKLLVGLSDTGQPLFKKR